MSASPFSGRHDPVVVMEEEVDIRRSPAEVFDYCADLSHEPEWNPKMTRIEKLTDGPVGLGTRYEAELVPGDPMVIEYVRLDRPTAWTTVGESRRLKAVGEGRVRPTNDGTHLDAPYGARATGAPPVRTSIPSPLHAAPPETGYHRHQGEAGGVRVAGLTWTTLHVFSPERGLTMNPKTSLTLPSTVSVMGALVALYGLKIRPWLLDWGATADERTRPLPGDDLVPDPTHITTSAIHVNDLAVVFPLIVTASIWLWKRQARGYLFAGVMLVLLVAVFAALLPAPLFQSLDGRPVDWGMMPLAGPITLLTCGLLVPCVQHLSRRPKS